MSHSNSSLNCFANCMAKYNHSYILKTLPDKPPSIHLIFGTMAHDVLYKFGTLRDQKRDGIESEVNSIIPSDLLYNDCKEAFNISHWYTYFMPIFRQLAIYEEELFKQITLDENDKIEVYREQRCQLTPDELVNIGYTGITQPLVGIIDYLIINRTQQRAIILDYKFSSSRKGQDEFDMNSQLQLYAFFVNQIYDIPLYNIQIGYIDIPKSELGKPTVLSNGTLSRAKTQNVSQELYEKAVIAIHGDDPYYNCKEGGYYYDCWQNLALVKAAYLTYQYIDIDTYRGIMKDLLNAAYMIDHMNRLGLPYLSKYDSYSCKGCEYLHACKPWLTVGNKNE